MSNTITYLGVMVFIIGIAGIFGWVYAYTQINSQLSMLATVESGARTVSAIPFIGGLVGGATTSTANVLSSIRTSITMFYFYNMLLNLALIFTGIGLICTGRDMSDTDTKITKIRKYLLKNKEKMQKK